MDNRDKSVNKSDMPRLAPQDVASLVLKGVETGIEDVDVGDMAQGVATGMKADSKAVEKDIRELPPWIIPGQWNHGGHGEYGGKQERLRSTGEAATVCR